MPTVEAKCGKKVDARGKCSHERACQKCIELMKQKEPEPVQKAEPKIEPAPEQKPETIKVVQDYTEVPKLPTQIEAAPVIEPPKTETPKQEPVFLGTEEDAEKAELVDFSGIDEVAVSIIDSHFRKNNIPEWTEDEKNRLRKFTNKCLKKYAYVFVKYADVINLGIALSFPFLVRMPQILEAREKNKKNEAQNNAPSAPVQKTETEAERLEREYAAQKKEEGK